MVVAVAEETAVAAMELDVSVCPLMAYVQAVSGFRTMLTVLRLQKCHLTRTDFFLNSQSVAAQIIPTLNELAGQIYTHEPGV